MTDDTRAFLLPGDTSDPLADGDEPDDDEFGEDDEDDEEDDDEDTEGP